jgi:hypothetical protein
MSHRVLVCILFVVLLFTASACTQSESTNQLQKRTDSATLQTEKEDLDQRLENDQKSFLEFKEKLYSLSATVTLSKEKDAFRIKYEILMDDVQSEFKNVIQSFTLSPSMMNYVDTPDLINTNAHNEIVTDLKPNEYPVGLSLSRAYVLKPANDWSVNNPSYLEDMYIKISYGPDDKRTEDYWHIRAVPSPELTQYLSSKK